MRKFLKNIIVFCLIIFAVLCISLLSPTPYAASQSMLFSSLKKDSLLQNTPQPRIVLMGGSNVSYGMDSQLIKDSLEYNVINTGIHAGLGLKYILEDIGPKLKSNDICIIIPEYEQFYGAAPYGSEQLLRMIFDVSLTNAKKLNWSQIKIIYRFIPQYVKSKLVIKNYYRSTLIIPYRHTAFNEYGDAYLHWDRQKVDYKTHPMKDEGNFNYDFFNYFVSYIHELEKKGIIVYISFPGIEEISYSHNGLINGVYANLQKSDIKLLGTPEDFTIPESMTYDTPYHLTRKGIEKRTNALIHFLKKENISNTISQQP